MIIPFRRDDRPKAAAGEGSGPARIFSFTGVRYERHDDANPTPVLPIRRRREAAVAPQPPAA